MARSHHSLQGTFDAALNACWTTIKRTIPKMNADRPCMGREDLTYTRCGDRDWVDGFWSGQLWLGYSETGDEVFLDAAHAQLPYFYDRLDRPETHDHDLGFLYSLSLVASFKLTGDTTARDGALRAAEALARRYNPKGQFIRAWNDWGPMDNRGRMIIDCLENLGLLFWATEVTGEARFAEIATRHAHTTRRYILRADGSSYHSFVFDPDTGEPLRGETYQGYSNESRWSRGQSWGVHGFSQIYRYTHDPAFLAAAQQMADFVLAHLPDDAIPYWDYALPPNELQFRDTSAAAVTAAGLIALADQVTETADAERYTDTAQRMLVSLSTHYSTRGYAEAEGLLVQGAADVPRGLSSAMLPYGDYYYVEALLRALGRKVFFW
jgi:unsaturated chondroitin disaccharide hydrolase